MLFSGCWVKRLTQERKQWFYKKSLQRRKHQDVAEQMWSGEILHTVDMLYWLLCNVVWKVMFFFCIVKCFRSFCTVGLILLDKSTHSNDLTHQYLILLNIPISRCNKWYHWETTFYYYFSTFKGFWGNRFKTLGRLSTRRVLYIVQLLNYCSTMSTLWKLMIHFTSEN